MFSAKYSVKKYCGDWNKPSASVNKGYDLGSFIPFEEHRMSKIHDQHGNGSGISGGHYQVQRNWLFDIEPFARSGPKSFAEVVEDERLKRALKCAVSKTEA